MTLRSKLIFSFLSMAILVAVSGFTGGFFISQVADEGNRVGERLAPLGDAAMELQLSAMKGHLKLEEILAGDTSENIDDVWKLLQQSEHFADLMISGGTANGLVYLPTQNDEIRSKINQVKSSIGNFIKAAHERYDQRTRAQGAGSDVDIRFDALYSDIQQSLDGLMDKASLGTDRQAVRVAIGLGKARYFLANGHLYLEEYLSGDQAETSAAILQNFTTARDYLQGISDSVYSSEIRQVMEKIQAFVDVANQRISNMTNIAAAGSKVEQDFDNDFDAFNRLAVEAEDAVREDIATGLQSAQDAKQTALTTVTAIGIIGAVLALGLALFLGRMISHRVTELSGTMTALVDGNLKVTVPGIGARDEFGKMSEAVEVFKQNAIRIREMEGMAERIVDSISQTTSQISSAIVEQAASSSEQAAAVSQTSTSLSEISESANGALDRVSQLNSTAENGLSRGEVSQRNMNRVIAAMGDIRDRVNAIAHTMMTLGEQTRRVSEITDSVSALAKQSKMLAINASIEAAKAGESGQGFAVVAEEVANLAEQSEQATVQVRTVLAEIRGASEKAILATEEGTKQVDLGVELIETVGNDMTDLMAVLGETVTSTRSMVEVITQQNTGIQQVNGAMNDIDQGTSQIATSTSQIRGAMEGLTQEVSKLKSARTA